MSERGVRSIAVLAETGKWLPASRRRYQSDGIGARTFPHSYGRQFAPRRNQGNGPTAVVAKTGVSDGIGSAEIVVEVDGIEERPSRIAGVFGGDR